MYQPPKWPCSYFLKALEFYLTVLFSWISKNVFYLESLWFSTTQKIKFSIKDFFSKCDQIRRKLRTWSHLLKKSLIENFIFCAVDIFNDNCSKNFWYLQDNIHMANPFCKSSKFMF